MILEPLTDREYQLERFPGKGGWTYAAITGIQKNKEAAFGFVRVKGTIDGYPVKSFNLMPLSNGRGMMMVVKAEIRKTIKKEEGDYVHITLFADNDPFVVREDFKERLEEHEGAYQAFIKYKQWEQRMCIEWIYSAKRQETIEERIKKTIGKIFRREKLI